LEAGRARCRGPWCRGLVGAVPGAWWAGAGGAWWARCRGPRGRGAGAGRVAVSGGRCWWGAAWRSGPGLRAPAVWAGLLRLGYRIGMVRTGRG
jgi:hypothetical protein